MKNEILGIDLGNTIIKNRVPLPDAFRVIRLLIERRFRDRVVIVSRVNEEQEVRARAFVTSKAFVSEVGIPLERVHFCRKRDQKGPICKRLGITHFIDDRPEVMAFMPESVVHKILFNPDHIDFQTFANQIGEYSIVNDWNGVERLLLS